MAEPTKEIIKCGGTKDGTLELYSFSVPMWHEDWHKAEELDLVYIYYDDSGNNYWDNIMVFAKKENEEAAKEWNRNNKLW